MLLQLNWRNVTNIDEKNQMCDYLFLYNADKMAGTKNCGICIQKITKYNNFKIICGHIFHYICFEKFLRSVIFIHPWNYFFDTIFHFDSYGRTRSYNRCPICRTHFEIEKSPTKRNNEICYSWCTYNLFRRTRLKSDEVTLECSKCAKIFHLNCIYNKKSFE